MGLTYKQAFEATNPDQTDEQRDASARAIMSGQAANEAYWNSRSELEALRAQADGHGVVVRGADSEDGSPTVVDTTTVPESVEGSAEDEQPTGIGTTSSTAADQQPAADQPPPAPDNPTEAVATLRKQLEDAGITPGA